MSAPAADEAPQPLRLRTVPPRQGVVWVRSGFKVFAHKPLAFCLLVLVYGLVGQSLLQWSPVGNLIMFAVVPLASLGFMIATRVTLESRTPWPTVFVDPLRRGRNQTLAQLKLSIIHAACVGLIVLLVNTIGADAFDALAKAIQSGKSPDDLRPLLLSPSMNAALLVMMTLLSVLSVPFWHAPALVHWDRQGIAKALFASTMACWRNRGALAVYMLTWCVLMFGFFFTSLVVFALLGAPQMAAYTAPPAGMLFATVFYASLYFSFADSFERRSTGATAETLTGSTS